MKPWWTDCPAPGRLAVVPRPRGGDWLADDLRLLRAQGVDILVSALTADEEAELELEDEERLWAARGLHFVRVPTSDFGVPALGDAARVLSVVASELLEGQTVAVHCRMGVGRSPLIAASVLVALGLQPDEAWRRVQLARGTQVPDTEAQRDWVARYAEWLQSAAGRS